MAALERSSGRVQYFFFLFLADITELTRQFVNKNIINKPKQKKINWVNFKAWLILILLPCGKAQQLYPLHNAANTYPTAKELLRFGKRLSC